MSALHYPWLNRPFQRAVVLSAAFHGAVLASGWLRPSLPPSMGRELGPLVVRLAPGRENPPTASASPEAAIPAARTIAVPVRKSGPTAESPSPPAASAPVSAPGAGEEDIVPPQFGVAYLNNPPPDYPALAKRMGLEGEARIKVRVSSAGLPLEIQLAHSSGYDVLDEAARNAVQRWRFVPARQGSRAVEAWVVVPLKFRLAGEYSAS